MATIKIDRTSERMNRMRSYKIYMDDKIIGDVKDGGSEAFEIESGTHTLYAKVDWYYSPAITFTINETEIKYFNVGAFKYANVLMPVGAVLAFVGFAFMRTKGAYVGLLALPIICIMFYYFTFGRKKYLALTEESLYQPKSVV